MENLADSINHIANNYKNSTIWFGGDLNLPNINWGDNTIIGTNYSLALCNTFLDLLTNHGFTQMNLQPTRHDHILDIFLTNRPALISGIEVVPGISDHEAVCVTCNLTVKSVRPTKRQIYVWNKADFVSINQLVTEFANSFLNNTIDTPVQDLWDSFKLLCMNCLQQVPTKTAPSGKFNQPWTTPLIRRLSSKKKRLYNRARRSNLADDWGEYHAAKKLMQKECRQAHNRYLCNMFNPDSNRGYKNLWSYVKCKKCDQVSIPPLEVNGLTVTDSQEKANAINKQFVSIYTKEDASVPSDLGTSPYDSVAIEDISVEGVAKLLTDLQSHKAHGPDNIPARLLKETAFNMAPLLTLIYKASLHQQHLPSDWKTAHVTPIFKKGSRKCPANYRPISLTSIPCKIFEHIIYSTIYKHLENNSILCDAQHGFRKHRSCETQLIITIHDIASRLNAGEQIDVLFLDFSKAFDKVPHDRLIYKLHYYGIRGSYLEWIKQFLVGRTQQVIIENKFSDLTPVTSGVPQGSVLGPLLFLLFINDLPCGIDSVVKLYADDVLMFRSIKDPSDHQALQNDLNKLAHWSSIWQMPFNLTKCEYLIVTNKSSPLVCQYKLNDYKLQRVLSAKYLGVTISSNLSWSTHISGVIGRANSALSFFRRNFGHCNREIKIKCYETYIRPICEYATVIWSPHLQSNIHQLEMVQRKAARFVFSDYSRYSSVSAMLNELDWRTLEKRRDNSILVMLHKIINQYVDIPHNQILHTAPSNTRSNSRKFLHLPSRIDSFKHSFFPGAIRLWNHLPDHLVEIDNVDTFKSLL